MVSQNQQSTWHNSIAPVIQGRLLPAFEILHKYTSVHIANQIKKRFFLIFYEWKPQNGLEN
jgi:hypothetical protein